MILAPMLLRVLQLEPEIGELIINNCNKHTTVNLNGTCRELRALSNDRVHMYHIQHTIFAVPIIFRKMVDKKRTALDFVEKCEQFEAKTSQSQARRNYLRVIDEVKHGIERIVQDINEENYKFLLKNMIFTSYSTLSIREWAKTSCAGTNTKNAVEIYEYIRDSESIPYRVVYEIEQPKKTLCVSHTNIMKTFLMNLVSYLVDIKVNGIIDRLYLDNIKASM